MVADIQTLHEWISESLDRKLDDFKRRLPEFGWSGSIVFMPTLFGFDAGSGQMNGRGYLIFGLDTIARAYGPKADVSVLFSHELFHLYHGAFHQAKDGEVRGKSIPLVSARLDGRTGYICESTTESKCWTSVDLQVAHARAVV